MQYSTNPSLNHRWGLILVVLLGVFFNAGVQAQAPTPSESASTQKADASNTLTTQSSKNAPASSTIRPTQLEIEVVWYSSDLRTRTQLDQPELSADHFPAYHPNLWRRNLALRKDSRDEPLPPGAMQRYGSIRYLNSFGNDSFTALTVSDDLSRLAAVTHHARTVVVFDEKGFRQWNLRFNYIVGTVALSPDGRYLLAVEAHEDEFEKLKPVIRVAVLDLQTQKTLKTWEQRGTPYFRALYSIDGKQLAMNSVDGLFLLNPDTFEVEAHHLPKQYVMNFRWSSDGTRIMFSDGDMYLREYDLKQRKVIRSIDLTQDEQSPQDRDDSHFFSGLGWSLDEKRAVVGYSNGYLALWDLEKQKVIQRYKVKYMVLDAYFLDDEEFLVRFYTGVRHFTPKAPEPLRKYDSWYLRIHDAPSHFSFSHQHKIAFFIEHIYHRPASFSHKYPRGYVDSEMPRGTIKNIQFASHGGWVYLPSELRFSIFDPLSGKILHQQGKPWDGQFNGELLRENNRWLVTSNYRGTFRVWDLKQNPITFRNIDLVSKRKYHHLAAHPDGRHLLIIAEKRVMEYDPRENRILKTHRFEHEIYNAHYDQTGQYLLASVSDGYLMYDLKNQQVIHHEKVKDWQVNTPASWNARIHWSFQQRGMVNVYHDSIRLFSRHDHALLNRFEFDEARHERGRSSNDLRWFFTMVDDRLYLMELYSAKVVMVQRDVLEHHDRVRELRQFNHRPYILITSTHDNLMYSMNPYDWVKADAQREKVMPVEMALKRMQHVEDSPHAYKAMWSLVEQPEATLKHFEQIIQKGFMGDVSVVELIKQLDADDLDDRDQASVALAQLWDLALNDINQAIQKADNPEMQWRLKRLRHTILHQPVLPEAVVIQMRMVQVLEWISGQEAQQLLIRMRTKCGPTIQREIDRSLEVLKHKVPEKQRFERGEHEL